MNDNIITECLAICDNIDDDHVDKFFPKFDKCLELSKNTGLEKKLFQKSLLGLVRKCRQDFLRETKMSFRDVTEIANDFSEYIRELMHLDGIESSEKKYFLHGHDTQIDKRASFRTNGQTSKFLDFLIFLIILTLITCLFGFLATRVYVALKRNNQECALKEPQNNMDNLILTCKELGLDPNEIKVLREKTCFDREYENIVNKYLQKRSESSGTQNN
uniref:Uncharacterized protein n=1 Tax=Rhodnius prolixus TaxID=13249 RepID=T1I3E5_RHOPR